MLRRFGVVGRQREAWLLSEAAEYRTRGGESPVAENISALVGSRVARGTWNPV